MKNDHFENCKSVELPPIDPPLPNKKAYGGPQQYINLVILSYHPSFCALFIILTMFIFRWVAMGGQKIEKMGKSTHLAISY